MMDSKLSNSGKSLQKLEAWLPALVSSGPLFLWMGLQNGINTALQSAYKRPDWLDMGVSMAGFFMLMLGLVTLLLKQRRLEQRLNELERVKS